MTNMNRILILGSGELGKELVIAAKRLGQYVIAVDNYAHAPAMQLADEFAIINMLDEKQLNAVVKKYKPNIIVPEIEAIRTECLQKFEHQGIQVVPSAKATHMTMNRDAIRDLAAKELQFLTAKYQYAESLEQLKTTCKNIGFPCVIKPVMSSSGKGQSIVTNLDKVGAAWKVAAKGMRGDKIKVIVEEYIDFDSEITLLTICQKKGAVIFLPPIGHRQERGDYQESWMPAKISDSLIKQAQYMAKKVTQHLGGAGIFGVEFFIKKNQVYFSELSPRPHDTGMVTMISQNLSEFDLHIRAILGLPIPNINYFGPSASAVILANKNSKKFPKFSGLDQALQIKDSDLRIFGKPTSRKYRRMGVALARGQSLAAARKKAIQVAHCIKMQ